MPPQTTPYKYWLLLLAAVLLVGGIGWYLGKTKPVEEVAPVTEELMAPVRSNTVIGRSVDRRPIEVYTYGDGPINLLFVGGMHGGYEWNSVVLAYNFIDYLNNHQDELDRSFTVHVIPDINPDGTYAVVGKEGEFTAAEVPPEDGPVGTGRFNANGVDLNRNFDCNWQPTSNWRSQVVSAGAKAFSEPEAATLRDYVEKVNPRSVIFWHSQADAVYASECNNGVLPETVDVMNAYSKAAGYKAVESFDAYPISGDAEGWLASQGIPAITVELSTHDTVEWTRNLAGIKALLSYYITDAVIAR